MENRDRLETIIKLAARERGSRSNQSRQKKIKIKQRNLRVLGDMLKAYYEAYEALMDAHDGVTEAVEVFEDIMDTDLKALIKIAPFEDDSSNKYLQTLSDTVMPKMVQSHAAIATDLQAKINWLSKFYAKFRSEYDELANQIPEDQEVASEDSQQDTQVDVEDTEDSDSQPEQSNATPFWQKMKDTFGR